MERILINIGRQFGSGGRLVAEALGRKLSIPVYDNELIFKAAAESGFSKDLFAKKDERRSFFSLSGFFDGNAFGFTDNYMNDNELFKIQSDVIRKIAQAGSAIFIGRCSDYILRDLRCLDVFITAPEEVRIKRVAEREGVDPEEAARLVKTKDRTRETYYNYFTFGNWGVASNYDLCIDSSVIGVEQAADLIISVLDTFHK